MGNTEALLPAVYGLAGIFFHGGAVLRASVVIDYQNVHLTARDVFDPGGPERDSLIHPMQFARNAIRERNARQRTGFPQAELHRVTVFRGLPHVDHDWEQHRRCIDQASQWREDGAQVVLRDLKYAYQRGADGRETRDVNGKKVPIGRPREKGIDVLCAVACINESERADIDVVVLASRDSDLVPVLDELYDRHGRSSTRYAAVETVAWLNRHPRPGGVTGGPLVPTRPRRIWNTNLGQQIYEASIDRTAYR
ncbi:hypothetical protein ACO0LV_16905 [Pseudactinotalea sp. Z1739]|uniref:hypothetical protein n=1 Tax=Pseudactinotalea sp. Z1739 TaxID=3413028 RepID=UPI003C79B43D